MSTVEESESPDLEIDKEGEELLLQEFPESTVAERRRFIKARNGDVEAAADQLAAYLDWRDECKLEAVEFDKNDKEAMWKYAARKATELECGEAIELPQLVCTHYHDESKEEITTKDGKRIVHLFIPRLDVSLAPAKAYGLAVAIYLECKFDANNMEKFEVCNDVRAGLGWPNPSPFSLLPFIRTFTSLLNAYFPERLQHCIVYPMPSIASYVWGMIKGFLDPDTATKMVIISGPAAEEDPPPPELDEYVDEEVLKIMEDARVAFYEVDEEE